MIEVSCNSLHMLVGLVSTPPVLRGLRGCGISSPIVASIAATTAPVEGYLHGVEGLLLLLGLLPDVVATSTSTTMTTLVLLTVIPTTKATAKPTRNTQLDYHINSGVFNVKFRNFSNTLVKAKPPQPVLTHIIFISDGKSG